MASHRSARSTWRATSRGVRQYPSRTLSPQLRLMLAQGGVLLDSGYLDPAGLSNALDRVEAGGYTERDAELFDVLAVEQAAIAVS